MAAVGLTRSQHECEVLCGTTGTDGTSPKRLVAAIRAVGRDPVVINERRAEVALLMLLSCLDQGRPGVLCVEDATHWVAAVGTLGPRVLIADPADNELVLSLTRTDLAAKWEHGGRFWE